MLTRNGTSKIVLIEPDEIWSAKMRPSSVEVWKGMLQRNLVLQLETDGRPDLQVKRFPNLDNLTKWISDHRCRGQKLHEYNMNATTEIILPNIAN